MLSLLWKVCVNKRSMKGLGILLTNGMDSRWTWFLVPRVTGLVHVHRCLLSLSEQCLCARLVTPPPDGFHHGPG